MFNIDIKKLLSDIAIVSLSVLGLMLVDPILHMESAEEGLHVESKLLILGFVLLIGSFAGRIAHRLQLPRLTGYLVAGVFIGPDSPVDFLRLILDDDLTHVAFIKDLAIGLIALMAGMEIRMAWLRARFRGISSVIVWETLCVSLSIMTMVMLLWNFMPFAAAVDAI